MNPRTSILELFSTFAYPEGDNFRRWITDTRLRRSIHRCVTAEANRSAGLWSIYWFQGLSQQELASQLKLSQSTGSCRLKKAEDNLLQALLDWIESQLNQFPDPNVLKSISTTLREWLIVHYTNSKVNYEY
jgi:hypothetical protein